MINLIPPVAKRAMRHEYWQRVAIVWLLLLAACIVLAGVLTAPSFVLVQSQLSAYQSQLQTAAEVATEQSALVDLVTRSNTVARTVLAAGEIERVTPYVQTLQGLTRADVTITRVAVRRVEGAITEVQVIGTAATRESLRSFSEQIEADSRFSEATVPLENLAANEDISFTLDIIVASET